jgi:hypothetical protein
MQWLAGAQAASERGRKCLRSLSRSGPADSGRQPLHGDVAEELRDRAKEVAEVIGRNCEARLKQKRPSLEKNADALRGRTDATPGVFVRFPQREEERVKNQIIVVAVLLVVVFPARLLPSYSKANLPENELREARRKQSLAQLRDWACSVYFQANQKDYGLAAGTNIRLFDSTREAAVQA